MRAWVLVMLAGCGFSTADNGDGGSGSCGLDVSQRCTASSARAYQPLGAAGGDSIVSSLIDAGNNQTLIAWEARVAGGSSSLYVATANERGATTAPRRLAAGAEPRLVRGAAGLELFYVAPGTSAGGAYDVLRQRLGADGASLGSAETAVAGVTDELGVAVSDAGVYGVVFTRNFEVWFTVLDANLQVVAAPVKTAQSGINSLQPRVAWADCGFVAAWTDARAATPQIWATRFDVKGVRQGSEVLISDAATRGSFPTVAGQATGGVVICHQQLVSATGGNHDIFCVRLDSGLQQTNRARLTQTATPSQNPAAVAHGHNTWVLWDDYPSAASAPTVRYNFLDETGTALLADAHDTGADTSGGNGWRAAGAVTSGALMLVQYAEDQSSNWSAEFMMENCF